MGDWQRTEWVDLMLDDCDTWAVVGLSGNPDRPAYSIAELLQRRGKRVVPIHPRFADDEAEVLDERGYPSLADVPFPVDVVDVFRRPDAVPDIARDAVAIGAKALWLQFGVVSPEGAKIAEEGGLAVVMDRCMKVEHARHLGRMHWLGFNTGRVTAKRERIG
jgi:uncharacterized protein